MNRHSQPTRPSLSPASSWQPLSLLLPPLLLPSPAPLPVPLPPLAHVDCAVARAFAASRTAARAVVRARVVARAIATHFAVAARRCRLRTRRLERRAQLRALGGELAHDAALGDDARVGAQPQLLALVMGVVEVVLRTRSGRACVSTRTLM